LSTAPRDDVTRILASVGDGDPHAARELLPLVYEELRGLAEQRMRREPAGLTLQPTALVHEAYLRLVGEASSPQVWNNRGHFFGAAAEAMRRILVERARGYGRRKHGGGRCRVDLSDEGFATPPEAGDDILALDEALTRLEAADAGRAEVVKLRYFAGLTLEQTAEVLGVSVATVSARWAYARAWLFKEIDGNKMPEST
jgi:RNA polymerase sigma factor (TIGR02999 family)